MPRPKQVKQILNLTLVLVLVVFSFLFVFEVLAQVDVGLEYATATGLATRDIRSIVANIIRVFLGLLGIIGVALILYGGFIWMTAAGDPEKVNKAKKILINAGIGLAIVLSAYAITSFIISRFLEGRGVGEAPAVGIPGFVRGGALGGGIVESHYPPRNGRDIPRNTKIIITFKEKMQLDTLINNTNNSKDDQDQPIYGDCIDGDGSGEIEWGECDQINEKNINIRKTVADPKRGPFVTQVTALTTDNKTFVFKPKEYLGSVSENVFYTVALASDIKKANGDKAFGGFGTYSWDFEVSTNVDSTPPQIESVIPADGDKEDRNVVIQINFNEAIDPTSVIGANSAGFNLVVKNTKDNSYPDGTFMISNQYRTVEFITEDWCGTNSCGGDVYCLPASADIDVLVKAASLSPSPPEARFPYDGVVDIVGNSLDGNKDGEADGPGEPPDKDNHSWSFITTNEIDLEPPVIETREPTGANIALDAPIKARFSKRMWVNTLNTSNIELKDIAYSIGAETKDRKTTVIIYHDLFAEDTAYTPELTSNLQDAYQNCYNPCKGP